VIKLAERYITFVEDSRVQFKYFMLTFLTFVTLRNFLEIFSDKSKVSIISFEGHLHFYLSYICMALTMMLLFHLATGEKIAKIARLILFSFFFVLSAPIFDLIISLGQGYDIAYLMPQEPGRLLLRYLTLGGSFTEGGVTIGLKLEGILVLLASFFYFRAKRLGSLKSLLFVLAIYTLVFTYAITPLVLQALLGAFGLVGRLTDSMLYAKFYLILIFAQFLMLAWKWNRRYCISILKDIRPLRQLHSQLMFALGAALGPGLDWRQDTGFDLALIVISIACACLFVIIANNLEDQKRDRSLNKARPLSIGSIRRDDYQLTGRGAGLAALAYAGAVSYYTSFTLLLCMGLYSLYSMPPLRVKRIPVLSKLPIALSSLACVIMGYVIAGGEIVEFPPLIILWFLVCFTAALNLIDIKDYEEDKRAGVRTLTVLWGPKRSKPIIGLVLLVAYVTAPLAFGQPLLLLPATVLGLAQYWLVNRRGYQERAALYLYLFSILFLIVFPWFAERLI